MCVYIYTYYIHICVCVSIMMLYDFVLQVENIENCFIKNMEIISGI